MSRDISKSPEVSDTTLALFELCHISNSLHIDANNCLHYGMEYRKGKLVENQSSGEKLTRRIANLVFQVEQMLVAGFLNKEIYLEQLAFLLDLKDKSDLIDLQTTSHEVLNTLREHEIPF